MPYYVMYDPWQQVLPDVLTIYCLHGLGYERQTTAQFPGLALGLTLWEGVFEDAHATWLRWTDAQGGLIPTGKELAEQERQRAEQAQQQAEQARQRAERLEAMLRQAGLDPEQA